MSNFNEFMDDPHQEEVGGSSDFKTIAKAKIVPAFQGWQFKANPKEFPYNGSKKDAIVAREKCREYCQGENSYPQAGLLTIIYGDDVPSHPEGAVNWIDGVWRDFIPASHSKKLYAGNVDVVGEYPYDLVFAGMGANPSVFCEVQWCKLSQPINNVRDPGRNKETNKYAHRVYVVEEIYKNREAAYAAAGKSPNENKENDFGDFGGVDDGLSAYAKKNNWTLEMLKEQEQSIREQIAEQVGKNDPDGKPMDLETAEKFVCAAYTLAHEDLKLLDEAPF